MKQRERALRRLSRLTVSAGVAGVAATIGFAGLAAATYRGHSATTDAGAQTAPDQSTTTGGTSPDGSQPLPTFAPVSGRHGNRQPLSANPPRRSFGGGGQITTGGSG